jgi:hypothetical protein
LRALAAIIEFGRELEDGRGCEYAYRFSRTLNGRVEGKRGAML